MSDNAVPQSFTLPSAAVCFCVSGNYKCENPSVHSSSTSEPPECGVMITLMNVFAEQETPQQFSARPSTFIPKEPWVVHCQGEEK